VDTAVTSPEALTVATAVLLLLQVPPDELEDKEEVDPVQIVVAPLMVPATAAGLTVTVCVAATEPQLLVTV